MVLGHIFLEHRTDWVEIEAAAGDVRMRERDLDGQGTLGGADVDKGLVVFPGKLLRHRHGYAEAYARHRAEEVFYLLRIGIQRGEWIDAVFVSILRLPSAQGLGQSAPVWI